MHTALQEIISTIPLPLLFHLFVQSTVLWVSSHSCHRFQRGLRSRSTAQQQYDTFHILYALHFRK